MNDLLYYGSAALSALVVSYLYTQAVGMPWDWMWNWRFPNDHPSALRWLANRLR